jgi:hypothetical protein
VAVSLSWPLINPLRLIEALERDGFRVSNPSGRNDLTSGSLLVSLDTRDALGRPYSAEISNIEFFVMEAVFEFKGVDFILDVARTMRQVNAGSGDRAPGPQQ